MLLSNNRSINYLLKSIYHRSITISVSSKCNNNNNNANIQHQLNGDMNKIFSYTPENGYALKSYYGNINIQNLPIHEYVWKNIKKWENRTASTCGITGRTYTYAQMRDRCAAFAIRLQKNFNYQKGDVIAVCLPNTPEFPIAMLGAIEAGLYVTTVNPIYTADEISRQLVLSGAKMIVGTVEKFSVLQDACNMVKLKLPIITVRTENETGCPTGAIDFFEVSSPVGVNFRELRKQDIHPEDISVLPFSSGTTGLPKGVMLTHNNITSNCEMVNAKVPNQSISEETTTHFQDVLPGILPFFHIYGLTCCLLSKLALGGKIITLPKFQPDTFLNTLVEHKATVIFLAPPIIIFMGNHEKCTTKHTDSVRIVMSGAAPLGHLDAERFKKKGNHIIFVQGYGLTEASPVTHLSPIVSDNYGSIGYPTASSEVKVVALNDPKFIGIGPNIEGEVLVRGPHVMKGYLNNKEATDEMIVNDVWCRTGDVGLYDSNGFFYIKDRLKELIKVKGYQVPPAELEEILRAHPKLLDAAVVGIPHARYGEVPRGFVVLKPNTGEVTEKEIQEYVAKKVVEYKHLIGGVQFVDIIPKNASGKIMRRDLKKMYC